MKSTARLTPEALIYDIWSRRQPDALTVGLTTKQVGFFRSLYRRAYPREPQAREYFINVEHTPPLEVVVYPNGAGFVRVAQYACGYDGAKWFIKPEYDRSGDS